MTTKKKLYHRVEAALTDPGAVEVTKQKVTQLDLAFVKTKDLSAQLTNAKWSMSFPGSDAGLIRTLLERGTPP